MSPVADATRITDLFLLLGEDPTLLREFERDPRRLLADSGLDDTAMSTVLAGDSDAVRAAVEEEARSDPARRHHVVTPRMCVILPGDGKDDDEGGDDEGGDDQGDDDHGDDAGDDDGGDEGDQGQFKQAARG